MLKLPTPISILETHFQHKLRLKDLAYWKNVSDDQWVEFAKAYLARMKAEFTPESMANVIDDKKIQLYFDYRLMLDYERQIEQRFGTPSALLGPPYPPATSDSLQDVVAGVLAPLNKHLLTSHALFIPDNFFRCFDALSDSYERDSWRKDPNVESAVRRSIRAILQWLPILASLRKLIETGAINFMPYYLVPSFPWGGGDRFTLERMKELDIPRDPQITPVEESNGFDLKSWSEQPRLLDYPPEPAIDCELAVSTWINARYFSLDPVFADAQTWKWASGIRFRKETKLQFTSDLISIDILPLGKRENNLSVQEITSMRRNEGVFSHIQATLIGCKEYLVKNVREDASPEFVRKSCREYVRDHLDPEERLKVIKILDSNLIAGTIVAVAVGAAFMTANPLVALGVPAVLTPKAFLTVEGMFDPKLRACARLEALL